MFGQKNRSAKVDPLLAVFVGFCSRVSRFDEPATVLIELSVDEQEKIEPYWPSAGEAEAGHAGEQTAKE